MKYTKIISSFFKVSSFNININVNISITQIIDYFIFKKIVNDITFLTVFLLTHPVNFPCGRKPEHLQRRKPTMFGWLTLRISPWARIKPTISDVKWKALVLTTTPPKPQTKAPNRSYATETLVLLICSLSCSSQLQFNELQLDLTALDLELCSFLMHMQMIHWSWFCDDP
jgi:hypothetical protein